MAEVASCRGSSSQSSVNTEIAELPEGLVLSPSMKAAMDRILPSSASQLLQQRLSFEDASLDEISLNKLPKVPGNSSKSKKMNMGTPDLSASHQNQTLSRQNSTLVCEQLDGIRENGDVGNGLKSKFGTRSSMESEPKKKRISRADLEVMTAGDAAATDYHERSSRRSSLEKVSSDAYLKTCSDSDDVSRPFAVVREKRKEKRKWKKKRDITEQEFQGSLNHHGDSEDDFVSCPEKEKLENVCKDKSQSKADEKVLNNGNHLLGLSENGLSNSINSGGSACSQEPQSKENCLASDDMSNNSFSSTKENVEHKFRLEHQKLPKIKLSCYHMGKHRNKIRKTFPACYVVIEQISALLTQTDSKVLKLGDITSEGAEFPGKVLPLSVRLKYLSTLCVKGLISCRKHKKIYDVESKTVFDNARIPDSEDDFEISRGGRSLRKRDKTICYVEPTEADIFLEYGRKRSRTKTKDVEDNAKEDDEEVKRRKLNPPNDEPVLQEDRLNGSKNDTSLANRDHANNEAPSRHNYARAKPPPGGAVEEVVIYPKGPLSKEAMSKAKSKRPEIRPAPTTSIAPAPSIQPPPGLISRFPPYVPAISTPPSLLCAATGSSNPTAASNSVRPQFCMVKMDGKDVLLQVLPPSSPGAASQGSTLLLPGGKRLVVPPNHQLAQQITRAPRLITPLPMSTMPMPLISSLSAGLQTAPIISTIAPRVPLTIPSISTSQGFGAQGIPSTSSLTPRTVTAVTVYPPHSTPVSATAPTTASATSSSRPSVTSVQMAAPNSTTVVRNIRMPTTTLRPAAPNQAAGVRAVRIFVPGCQATGVPGRFATLGSVASSSSLTRLSASSDLLPQRKQATDKLTPEQRAEKRRRLEKKYPLPPGVVIKTEPLESPTPAQSTSSYARSLLPGNIQVVSASRRPGVSGMQSIRFLNPASAVAALSAGGTMPLTNFIVRAGDGRQTILIPSSLGMLTSTAGRTSLAATSAASSVALSTSSASIAVTSVSSVLGGGTISILPTFTPAVSLCGTTVTTSSTSGSETAQAPTTAAPAPEAQSHDPMVAKLKAEIEAMNKLLVSQETMGLRGERAKKLKELLKKKESTLKDLLARSDCGDSVPDEPSDNEPSQLGSESAAQQPDVIEID